MLKAMAVVVVKVVVGTVAVVMAVEVKAISEKPHTISLVFLPVFVVAKTVV